MKKIPLVLVITLAVVLIGQAWLSERRNRVVTTTSSAPVANKPASTSPKAEAANDAVAAKRKPVVDLRGKGKIAADEIEAVAEDVGQRLMPESEGEEEREREGRKKKRYEYVGRVPKFSRQEATGANMSVVNNEPTQQTMKQSGKSFVGDLRNLPQTKPVKRERPEREFPGFTPRMAGNVPEPLNLPKIATRVTVPSAPAPAPLASFPGLDFNTWGAGHPPDTVGDVGPTHYIQSINSSVGVYDKATGNQLAAFTLDTFMSQGAFGNQCDNQNFGDPVVLYDTFEDRWVITDFAFTVDGGGNVSPAEAFQCVAVSKNSNPVSGGWNFYSIRLTDGLNDYPKFGVWPDGIYMSANMFGFAASGTFQGTRVWAFNKAQMYAGQANAQVISFNPPAGEFTLLPSNARLQTGTPPANTPNYFVSTQAFLNALSIYKFHVDWARISLSTFTGPDAPLATTSWPNTNTPVAPSLGGNNLDTLGIRGMMQNQYTNLAGAESLWTTHTVRRGSLTGFAAPRWYQTNVTGGTVAANLLQATTWDPDGADVIHRFSPSLAVNRNGDLALGYSTSNATTKPAIKYAGRLAADPVNTFSQMEQLLIQGAGTQTGNCGGGPCTRWGDYSAMSVAPDGCTFWYTQMYYAVDGLNHQTRIGSFSFPSCTPVSTGTVEGTVTATMGGAPISGATVTFGARTATTNGAGFYQFLNVPSGTYPTITASAPGYISSTMTNIVVTDGNTTVKDFSLATAAVSGCVTDTTTSDFQLGLQASVDLAAPADSVTLLNAPVLDQSNLAGTTTGTNFTATGWGGQTFTAGATGPLVKVDVQLFCNGCTGTTPNINVSIRATSGGLPTGGDLATAVLPGFSNGASAFFTVTFAAPTTVTAGTQYALILAPTANPSVGTGYFWIRSSPSTYAAGQRVTTANSGVTWATDVTRDFNFRTFIQTGFAASGNQTSGTLDANPATGATPNWTTLSWMATTPGGTTLQFQVAGSNNPAGPFNFVGPDTTAGTFFTTSGASLSQFNGLRYLKYKAYLATSNNAVTPTLSDVTICFNNVAAVFMSPTMHKAFGAAAIQAGGNTTVTLTLNNPNASALTNASFTDTLVNLSAVGGAVTGSCVGTTPATLSAGATALSFSGIGIPATGSCTVVFSVTSSTLGTHANTTSGITTTQTPMAGAASNPASLTVYGAPTIAKAFVPMAITAGGTSTVTVTVSNPNPLGLIAAFSDTLVNMSAVGGVVGGSCAMLAPTVLAANATALNFSGVILPASGSCTLSFGVRSNSVGSQPNATSGVTTDRTPMAGAPSNTATLTVSAPSMTTIAKAFSPATIPLGGTSTVQLTLTNTNPVGALASFTDNLTGMVAVGGNIGGTCGLLAAVNLTANSTALSFSGIVVPGNGNCLVTFDVRGTVAGAQTNTTSGVVTDQTTPNAGPPSNTATLTVVPTTIAKAFAPATIAPGGVSTVSLTLTNNTAPAVLVSFSDTLANMSAVGGGIGGTCASLSAISFAPNATNLSFSGLVVPANGSCVVTFAVTSASVGAWPNTTSGVTVNSSGIAGPASNTATLTVSGTRPTLASKAVRNDFDGDGKSDLARWISESGEWQVTFSGDNEVHRIALVEPNDKEEYVGVAADFDGDGKYDAAVWRASDGRWLIKHSLSGELVKAQYGLPGDQPMPADYDGDGRADLAVWREGDGLHIQRSSNLTELALYLGQPGGIPVIGDFNGDGQTDLAVFQASEGRWLLRDTATGQLSDVSFGQPGDTPTAADFDGDLKDDLMVLRAGTGYVLSSSDQVVGAAPWGNLSPGEAPVFGDYDGDKRFEPAIWHKAKAAWEVLFRQPTR